MAAKIVGKGSQYAAAVTDSEGKPLDGSKTYKIHLPPNIPAKDFWSFVVYDNQTRSMLQTDQQFPSIGSQKEGLVVNPDTSVDVWFGPTAPAGQNQTGCKPSPAKAGMFSFVFMAHCNRGSTRHGSRENLKGGEVKLKRKCIMKTRHKQNLFTAALACALTATTASAQTPPTYKMTTPIPEDITTPDSVETRLGTLNFFDGFPDDATVNKVMDNLDFSRGVQSFLAGLPGTSLVGMRKGMEGFGNNNP